MAPILELLLMEMGRCHQLLNEQYGFTNTGIYPMRAAEKALIWGIAYPSTSLYVYNAEEEDFVFIMRSEWERITAFPPPWPWDDTGMMLVIDPQYIDEEPWWRS